MSCPSTAVRTAFSSRKPDRGSVVPENAKRSGPPPTDRRKSETPESSCSRPIIRPILDLGESGSLRNRGVIHSHAQPATEDDTNARYAGTDAPLTESSGCAFVVVFNQTMSDRPPHDSPDRTDREAVLERLADTIELTHDRVERPEVDSHEDQELQIKWIRALGYLSGQYRKLLKDEDLDEMAEELELLQAEDGEPR
jgi:hypothetical protein